MTFIGFLAEKKDGSFLKKALKSVLEEAKIKTMTVAINEKSIGNVKNIHFETVIIDRDIKDEHEVELKEILKTTKYIIINADKVNIKKIENMKLNIITYGFGNKCTVTSSSVEEGDLVCLQRSINNINGIEIEPQEIKLTLNYPYEKQYLNMAIGTIKMLYYS